MLSNVLLLSDTGFKIYISFCYIFLVLTFIAALITVIIILFQKSNSGHNGVKRNVLRQKQGPLD